MMRKILLLMALLSFNGLLYAQIPDYLRPEYGSGRESKGNFYDASKYEKHKYDYLNSAIVARPYDVLRYDLYLDWYSMLNGVDKIGTDRYWDGSNKITAVVTISSLATFELDAVNLVINSVKVNNINLKSVPQPGKSGILSIPLPYVYKKGDTLRITVNYSYKSDNDQGFYLYPEKKYVGNLPPPFYDSVFVESRVAYTMSEPEDARYWMPCNDEPYDKAISSISVRVPKDYMAVSNGLVYKIDDMPDYKIYEWRDETPIATYLMAVTASKFATYSDWYKRVTNPKDSVEIQYYVWQKDFDATKTDGSQYNAHNDFQHTAEMVQHFSKVFSEYPFAKYGMVAIMPFTFGGMEHQTITSINRVWMRTNEQYGVAHELAHQWLGDLITCATWKDVWINEGGASWSEGLWAEHLGGSDAYMNHMYYERKNYLDRGGLALPAIYDLPINTIFDSYAVLVYQKASWVYHMLREFLGDSVYFPALRSMLNRYAHKSLETEDFKNSFITDVSNPPVDLNKFFDEWLYKAGHPVFDVSAITTKDGNNYNLNLRLSQVQTGTNVTPDFNTLVRVLIWGNNGTMMMDTLTVRQSLENYDLSLSFKPDSIKLDSLYSLLETKQIITSVQQLDDGDEILESNVIPNPVYGTVQASFVGYTDRYSFVNVELWDEVGNKVMTVFSGNLNKGRYNFNFLTGNLASGVYKISFTTGEKKILKQFVLIK